MTEPTNTKTAIGVSGAILLIGAIAANLKPIAEGLNALWPFLQALWLFLAAMTAEAPAGVGAFFLSLALAVLVQPAVRRALREARVPCSVSIEFLSMSAGLLVGVVVMTAQAWSFKGLLVGILVGLLSSWVERLAAALWSLGGRWFGKRAGTS